jgi:hypothetical protein
MEEKKPVRKATKKAPPASKSKVSQNSVTKEETEVALFSSGNLFHPSLGRLKSGYNILDPNLAKEWIKISEKVREATPQEVASAYGV